MYINNTVTNIKVCIRTVSGDSITPLAVFLWNRPRIRTSYTHGNNIPLDKK